MNNVLRWLRSDWGQTLVMVLLLFAARSSLADHYYVPSGSMEYSLMPGDRVFVDKTAYGFRVPFTKIDLWKSELPKAGEIAVFESPVDGTLLIKRIVAVGGDHVVLSRGNLWVNGVRLSHPPMLEVEHFGNRAAYLNLEHGGGPDIGQLVVPDNSVLVLGDHRGNSFDGRFFGFISVRELYGRAIGVYYSRAEGFQWEEL